MVTYEVTSETAAAETAVAAYEVAPITTLDQVAIAEGLKEAADTAIEAVVDVAVKTALELRVTNQTATILIEKTTLQAEVAVAAYEAAPITTLDQVAIAEGLKAAADTAVEVVVESDVKTAFALRVTNQTAAITTAKTALQAEAAVTAYEAAPITTLEEVATAEGLKEAADTAVEAVADGDAKTALELRVTNQTVAIATAKDALTPVVDDNGEIVAPATWFTDLIAKLQLALTFDPVRKCELNEQHALAKLAKAQKMMMNGDSENAEIYLNQYTDKIAKAQAFLEQVEDPTSEAAITLSTALNNVNSNNVVVLSNLIDKLPPQAAQKLALNVVRSMEKAVNKLEKEEAKVADETTPATLPVVDHESLEKQTKVALEEFKKSLIQKGKVHLDDLEQDQRDGDKNVAKQSKPKSEMKQKFENQSQENQAKVNPIKEQTTPTNRTDENNKDDRNKQTDRTKDNGRNGDDNNRRDDR